MPGVTYMRQPRAGAGRETRAQRLYWDDAWM